MIMTNTDAFVLMQFKDAVAPFKNLPFEQIKAKMLEIGKPFFDKLTSIGHSKREAVNLLRLVYISI